MSWWKVLLPALLLLPSAAYVAGALTAQPEGPRPRPALILPVASESPGAPPSSSPGCDGADPDSDDEVDVVSPCPEDVGDDDGDDDSGGDDD